MCIVSPSSGRTQCTSVHDWPAGSKGKDNRQRHHRKGGRGGNLIQASCGNTTSFITKELVLSCPRQGVKRPARVSRGQRGGVRSSLLPHRGGGRPERHEIQGTSVNEEVRRAVVGLCVPVLQVAPVSDVCWGRVGWPGTGPSFLLLWTQAALWLLRLQRLT